MKKKETINEKIYDAIYKFFKKLLIKLRGRKIKKENIFSKLLFSISILFFSLSLTPTIFSRLPFYDYFIDNGIFPYELTIKGSIYIMNEKSQEHVSNAQVKIGGFGTTTLNDGSFNLNFISKTKNDIPLVINYNNSNYIFYIQYSGKQMKISEDFKLNEN